ncbi:hypothetical protein CWE08_11155 [Aliidiomarina iranensis]|uniref:AB hydrolase-1 domain-containing protein n=1 Tax=Aliidiomarina iranensis TaxID=1434071 RepID=A0A432VQJ2_9GAMM|nr:alpha/beta hydrolase [Aliidiomarina iranensis]RUO18470.1 hypothetical protein CWE08_11155 [Aliidiomarina iranensis]
MRVLKWFGIGLVLLLLAVLAYVFIAHQKNFVESQRLNVETRAQAPGDFVELTDGYTHYQIAGPENAPVVVLVHGFSIPMAIWGGTYRALESAGYRVLRYDLFGRGYSDRPRVQYTGAVFEKQLIELLDALDIQEPVVLAGLSMGGAVVMRTAANHPQRVAGNILIAPLHQPLQPPPMPERIGYYMLSGFYVPTIQQSIAAPYLSEEDSAAMQTAYDAQLTFRGFTQALTSSFYAFTTENHPAYYRTTKEQRQPTLLIWGTQDAVVPYSYSEGVQADAYVVDFLTVEGAGHTPHLEQAELVNQRILKFLNDL